MMLWKALGAVRLQLGSGSCCGCGGCNNLHSLCSLQDITCESSLTGLADRRERSPSESGGLRSSEGAVRLCPLRGRVGALVSGLVGGSDRLVGHAPVDFADRRLPESTERGQPEAEANARTEGATV